MCFLASQVFTVCAHRVTGVQQCPSSRKRQEKEGESTKINDYTCKFIGFGSNRSTKSTGQIVLGWCPKCTSAFTEGNVRDEKVIRRYWAIKGLYFIDRPMDAKRLIGAYLFSTVYDGILDDELLGDQCGTCARELINGTPIGPYLNGVRESTLEWARSLARTHDTNIIVSGGHLSTIPETPDERAEHRSQGARGDSTTKRTAYSRNDVSLKNSVPSTGTGTNYLERTGAHDTRSDIENQRRSVLRKDFLPYLSFF